jgi:hypothetical protein
MSILSDDATHRWQMIAVIFAIGSAAVSGVILISKLDYRVAELERTFQPLQEQNAKQDLELTRLKQIVDVERAHMLADITTRLSAMEGKEATESHEHREILHEIQQLELRRFSPTDLPPR